MFYQYLTTDIKSSKTKKIEFSNDILDTPGIVSVMSSVDSGASFFSFLEASISALYALVKALPIFAP